MSRIFEALQKSESERSGTPLTPPALATELLQVVEREAIGHAPTGFTLRANLTLLNSSNLPISRKMICVSSFLCQSRCRRTTSYMPYRPGKLWRGKIPFSRRSLKTAAANPSAQKTLDH